MKKYLMIFLSLALAVVFSACNKDDDKGNNKEDDGENNNNTQVYLPSKIIYDGETTTFTYDNQRRVTEQKNSYTTNTYTYNSDGTLAQVVKLNEDPLSSRTITYEYKENAVERIATGSKSTYEYVLKDNRIVANNSDLDSYSYTYDAVGNMIKQTKQTKVGYKTYENTYEYTYDNKNGVFKNVNIPQWYKITELYQWSDIAVVNNALTDGDLGWKLEYVYNENGYPTSCKMYEEGSLRKTMTIEYTLK
ncbi:MAG: hypothetical protein LBN27_09725 [Prevotellaceae bacterium]|jgi:hypothetical protein|nr:hypothetical protein [Prevotellaceae bacterium]